MSEDRLTPADILRAVDQRALLPGEDPSSTYLEDAVHWIRVYEELIGFKDAMLDRADLEAGDLTAEATADINVDRRLLRAQAARYRARYAFWMERVAELTPTSTNGVRPTSPHRLHVATGLELSTGEAH